MNTTHTPGPWEWARQGGEITALVSRHPEGGGAYVMTPEAVCDDERSHGDTSIDISDANARLIATAPELLDAARMAEEALRMHGSLNDDMERAWNFLIAAIAKATA